MVRLQAHMNPTRSELEQKYELLHTDELLRLHAEGGLTDLAYEVLETELRRRGTPVPDRPSMAPNWMSARYSKSTTAKFNLGFGLLAFFIIFGTLYFYDHYGGLPWALVRIDIAGLAGGVVVFVSSTQWPEEYRKWAAYYSAPFTLSGLLFAGLSISEGSLIGAVFWLGTAASH